MKFSEEFGAFCAKGELAVVYLNSNLVPALDAGEDVVLDFKGVRNMNSSFANALFSNLIRARGLEVLNHLSLVNVRSNVQSAIKMGLHLGALSAEENRIEKDAL